MVFDSIPKKEGLVKRFKMFDIITVFLKVMSGVKKKNYKSYFAVFFILKVLKYIVFFSNI